MEPRDLAATWIDDHVSTPEPTRPSPVVTSSPGPSQVHHRPSHPAVETSGTSPADSEGPRDSGADDLSDSSPRAGIEPRADATTLLLTLDEAARELRCARRSLERYIERQELEPVRFGRCVRLERAELQRFIERRRGWSDAATA